MEGKIYQAIVNVMGEIGAIGKDRKNQQQGFMYRGVEDVMNAIQPIMHKHGIFVVPEVIAQTREERQTKNGSNLIYSILTVKHHFISTDGSEVVSVTIGEGMDSADKASNKAMSVAFKYACFEVFCIPTSDMNDPDSTTPPNSTPKNEREVGKVEKGAQNKPSNGQKTNVKIKGFQPLTKAEMVEVYGVKNVMEMLAWLEKQCGVKYDEWDEEITSEARAVLETLKKKRETDARKMREGLQQAGSEVPFPGV